MNILLLHFNYFIESTVTSCIVIYRTTKWMLYTIFLKLILDFDKTYSLQNLRNYVWQNQVLLTVI